MPTLTTEWPEKLNDEEAILRLQSVLNSAAEGELGVSADRNFKKFRTPLIRRADLSDVVPPYIRAHRDIVAFNRFIKGISDSHKDRREYIAKSLAPLFDRIAGRSSPPLASAKWTGRRTPAQQAQIVLSLAPDALQGVRLMLEEQERALGNGGPIDAEQADAIAKLKELRSALDELIRLAEGGKPLNQQLQRIRKLIDSAFRWTLSPYGLNLVDMPLVATNTVLGCGVMYLVNALTKGAAEGAAIGAAAMGVHGAAALNSRSKKASGR